MLHDYFEALEGGGRLSSIAAKQLQATLGYGFAKKDHPFLQDITQTLDLKKHSAIPLWRQLKLARAFQNSQAVKAYDLVLYSGSYAPLAINQRLNKKNILYCHTPPRFLYDQRQFFIQQLPIYLRPFLISFLNYLQPRYENAAKQMNCVIANSANVQQRIKHYLNLDAPIIYPPCDVERWRYLGQGDYYLSTARLDPLKRVDLIIQAFLQMPDKKLVIASGGSDLPRLQHLAANAPNIYFTGWLSEREWQHYLGYAIATLYLPIAEDFGMSPVESMAAGKPVIGVAEGGLLETILPEKTGILLEPSVQINDIIQAVNRVTPAWALQARVMCEQQARCFSTAVFIQKLRTIFAEI